jgi:cob(I)alamin adenosyltransferase
LAVKKHELLLITGKEATTLHITHLEPKQKKGIVLVITGHGKGKTTTAFGIVVRACGHNMKAAIVQFMKGDLYTGEWDGVKK